MRCSILCFGVMCMCVDAFHMMPVDAFQLRGPCNLRAPAVAIRSKRASPSLKMKIPGIEFLVQALSPKPALFSAGRNSHGEESPAHRSNYRHGVWRREFRRPCDRGCAGPKRESSPLSSSVRSGRQWIRPCLRKCHALHRNPGALPIPSQRNTQGLKWALVFSFC